MTGRYVMDCTIVPAVTLPSAAPTQPNGAPVTGARRLVLDNASQHQAGWFTVCFALRGNPIGCFGFDVQ
ncbi:MAG TPA: hypothetical protein VK939_02365 [Longimicrobiales bacterium]|nr:hypothetical protein [Longimicrobiales bacterium]